MKKVELLAPARDLEAGLAAVECGADAVYIGGPGFGARQAAGNSVEDIEALVRRAHLFGVRVYATLNTLLMDDELAEAASVAQSLLDVGVDALIVQDMAYLRMDLRALDGGAPEFHASTQTAAMTPSRVRFLASAGFSRVVLERAMSLDEIRAVAASISAPPAPPRAGADDFPREVELETFVHGAICVGFSGHCYLSRAMPLRQAQGGAGGQRSGNRGTCSQPCRLTWDLVDSGGEVLARGKHLLSVRDLDLSARLGELLAAGVTSLKIEGRLKDAGYVRNVVSYYNKLLDELGVGGYEPPRLRATQNHFVRSSAGRSVPDFTPNPLKSFTRGASEWFLDGSPRQAQDGARGDFAPQKGEYIGTVAKMACDRTGGRWVTLDGYGEGAKRGRAGVPDKSEDLSEYATHIFPKNALRAYGARSSDLDSTPIKARAQTLSTGDGICFSGGGTSVNRVVDGRIYLDDCQGVTVGTEIFRNYDRTFSRALSGSRTRRRIAVAASVETSAHQIAVAFVDETGIAATVSRKGDFAPARDLSQMAATLAAELSRSGDTIFAVTAGDAGGEGGTAAGDFFVPVSIIAALRREGLEKLLAERQKLVPPRHQASENPDEKFPETPISRYENITNRLSERFYRDHGATDFPPQLELAADLTGAVVMRSRYCLRREMGLCAEENLCRQKCADVAPTEVFEGEDSTKGTASTEKREGATDARFSRQRELFLVHGGHRFRVETDCARCEMTLVKL